MGEEELTNDLGKFEKPKQKEDLDQKYLLKNKNKQNEYLVCFSEEDLPNQINGFSFSFFFFEINKKKR